jgi:hypothetical protein
MCGRLSFVLFPVLLIGFISCSKEDSSVSTQYLIASELSGNPNLSIYSAGSGKVEEIPLKGLGSNSKILDILLVPKGLFIVSTTGIQLLNPLDWSQVSNASYVFPELSYATYSKGVIYVAVNENGFSYLRTYDENSLALIDNKLIGPVRVYALSVTKNRIFISYDKSILVLDADLYGKVGELELTGVCATLLSDSQSNILVFYEDKCTIIFNSESKISNFTLIGAQTLFTTSLRSSAVLDRETDILYFFQTQVGNSQLVLASFDIRRNIPQVISPTYYAGEGIYFDQKSKHIILTEQTGRVTVIDVNGKLIESTDIPGRPIKIVFKFN